MSSSASSSARRPGAEQREEGELGQAATELALVLPLLTLLLLMVVQVTLVARDQVLLVHAARAAARQAAVDPRPAAVRQAAEQAASSLKSGRMRVERDPNGGAHRLVTVVVHYRAPTDVPLVGSLVPDLELRAKAAMRSESGAAAGNSARKRRLAAGTAAPEAEVPLPVARRALSQPD